MGLDLKRNRAGLYQIKGENEWLTEDDVKKLLIEIEYDRFRRSVIEIDMEFPNDYYVNNKVQKIEEKHVLVKVMIFGNRCQKNYFRNIT